MRNSCINKFLINGKLCCHNGIISWGKHCVNTICNQCICCKLNFISSGSGTLNIFDSVLIHVSQCSDALGVVPDPEAELVTSFFVKDRLNQKLREISVPLYLQDHRLPRRCRASRRQRYSSKAVSSMSSTSCPRGPAASAARACSSLPSRQALT